MSSQKTLTCLWVAYMIRTSTGLDRFPPTLVTHFSSTTFRSLARSVVASSPISSRNRAPPAAASNLPSFEHAAPVNAPFSCPNSSDSMRESDSSAQLTDTIGRPDRGLRSWISFAVCVLPVPVSPRRHRSRKCRLARSSRFPAMLEIFFSLTFCCFDCKI